MRNLNLILTDRRFLKLRINSKTEALQKESTELEILWSFSLTLFSFLAMSLWYDEFYFPWDAHLIYEVLGLCFLMSLVSYLWANYLPNWTYFSSSLFGISLGMGLSLVCILLGSPFDDFLILGISTSLLSILVQITLYRFNRIRFRPKNKRTILSLFLSFLSYLCLSFLLSLFGFSLPKLLDHWWLYPFFATLMAWTSIQFIHYDLRNFERALAYKVKASARGLVAIGFMLGWALMGISVLRLLTQARR